MARQFHLFMNLPTELRYEIWNLCLPRRVIDLDLPMPPDGFFDTDFNGEYCDGLRAHENGKPPVISRVCRESRKFALEYNQAIKLSFEDGSLPQWRNMNHICDTCCASGGLTWRSPRTDIFHMSLESTETSLDSEKSEVAFINSLAIQCKSKEVSISNILLNDIFDQSLDFIRDQTLISPRVMMNTFEKVKNYHIIVGFVMLHVPEEAALKSGLFGLLGDSPVQLLDPLDDKRMKAFSTLWRREAPASDDCMDTEWFTRHISKPDRPVQREQIERLKENWRKTWLWIKCWMTYNDPTTQHKVNPCKVWRKYTGVLTASQVTELQNKDPTRFKISEANAWVQEMGPKTPNFMPKLMVRLCKKECHLKFIDNGSESESE